MKTGYPLKLHSQIPCVLPVFSMSNHKFSLCQIIWFVTITYTKLTWQTYPALEKKKKFATNIKNRYNQGIYNLSKPNSLCFGKISKFPLFTLTGIFFGSFYLFFPVQWVPCEKHRYPVHKTQIWPHKVNPDLSRAAGWTRSTSPARPHTCPSAGRPATAPTGTERSPRSRRPPSTGTLKQEWDLSQLVSGQMTQID